MSLYQTLFSLAISDKMFETMSLQRKCSGKYIKIHKIIKQ